MLDGKKVIRMKLYGKYLTSKKTNEYSNLDKSKQKIVVALAADYGNLGDVAITFAQTQFLKKQFPEAEVIDFPISKTFSQMKSLKSIIDPNDIITIVGGGNTGDMYDDIEFCRQFIIKQFPNNKIVCFPQTIDFSETSIGRRALEKALKVYGKHKNLSLSAREEKSFDKFRQTFVNNRVVIAPDIVLSLEVADEALNRQGVTFVLREDKEKNISESSQKELIAEVSANYPVRFKDTHINKSRMTVKERIDELNSIWNVFRTSEIIITDRLHGMIFSAITNTPCIAINNSNKKVAGVYNAWLKDFQSIKVVENFSVNEAMKLIKELTSKGSITTSKLVSNDEFNDLLKLLKE